jgi:hypothetical protein
MSVDEGPKATRTRNSVPSPTGPGVSLPDALTPGSHCSILLKSAV